MLELADGTTPRAFLRVGGTTIAQQQLALALALGCQRLVCIAHGLRPPLIALQHEAERAGVQFHVIAGPQALLGLVTAQDEVFVFGDGLFVSRKEAADLLEQGPAVLVQPIEQGLAAGFERIDINHAAAAAMRIPGRLVDQIAELPADCDAASALQRIALQGGVRQRAIPSTGDGHLFWTLVRSDDEAHAIEPRWIRQRTRDDAPLTPSRAIALFAVRRFGPSLLHAGSGAAHLAVAAGGLGVMALGAGWLKLIGVGLILCGLGWILREASELLARIDGDGPRPLSRAFGQATIYGLLLDAVMIGLAGWAVSAEPWQPMPDRFFPPFMLVALLRMLPRILPGRWTAWLDDRALLALGLAGAVASGKGSEVIHLAAAVAAVAGIALPGLQKRLTPP